MYIEKINVQTDTIFVYRGEYIMETRFSFQKMMNQY